MDFAVELSRLDKAADCEFSLSDCVAVRKFVAGGHIAETVVCDRLCFRKEKDFLVFEKHQLVKAVVLPVVFKAVGFAWICLEIVTLAVTPYFEF